jgi:chloramphenicol-sensitive protein RarD
VPANKTSSLGALYAVAAYSAWGLVAIYWKALGPVPAVEVLAHRVAWSLLFVAGLMAATGRLRQATEALRSRKTAATLALTTALISGNWGLFIWAVQSGRLLESSLGYFINPLVNVLFGVVFLGERLRRLQKIAVGMALLAVVVLTAATGVLPWVSLVLAFSFASYGLLRKTAAVDSLTGLFIETAMLAPVAAGYICFLEVTGRGALGQGSAAHGLLLAACGLITAVPLLWFTSAARLLPLSTLGFFQYIAPTCQFLLAVLVYGEPIGRAQTGAFALIWAALAVFSVDARIASRASRAARSVRAA